jgi:hypothetical protein
LTKDATVLEGVNKNTGGLPQNKELLQYKKVKKQQMFDTGK